jgi:hypothetical protein
MRMRTASSGLMLLLASLPAAAQTGGLAPEWVVRKDLATLAAHIQAIKPILDQAKPQTWRGAPTAYANQGERVAAEIGYLVTSTQELAARPEKLTVALATYFRMQSVDLMLRSYAEGIRKYQNPALAELLLAAVTTASGDRDKLRQYIVELAADREEALRVADEEAQRCRGFLSRQPRRAVPRSKEEHK